MRPSLRALSCSLLLGALAACATEPRKTDDAVQPASSAATTSINSAAALPAITPPAAAPPTAHHPGKPWFEGTTEQAFAEARAHKKLVFLYWGAVWCPPCNELKAEVFSRPRFAELMQGFVPAYLDGDTEEAQRWGEELKASGYPTILILSPEREELFRLNGSVDLAELEQAVQAVVGQSKSFKAVVQRLEKESGQPTTLTAEDARLLAHADWEQLPAAEWSPLRRFSTLQKAFEVCPRDRKRERAILASNVMSFAASGKGVEELAKPLADLATKAPAYLDAIFADAETAWAARSFINHRVGDTVTFLYGDRREEGYEALKKRWLAAAAQIGAREEASVDVRLWSVIPALDFFRREQASGAVPDALRAEIEAAVDRADKGADSAHERHSVISGAAYILRRVGSHERARAMLVAEAARTDTPWYYYGSLSALEQELGRTAEARAWSMKARQSAAGRATRLQWMTDDLVLNAKLESPEQKTYLRSLAEELYELATSLGDGFSGRNRARANQVHTALLPFRTEPEFVRLFTRYRERCEKLTGENKQGCLKHFDGLL